MSASAPLLTVLLLLAQAAPQADGAGAADPPPAPSLAELPRWREHVRPSAGELAYEAIPWIPDLAGGLQQAEVAGKPLLLWAMNGHPLGCT